MKRYIDAKDYASQIVKAIPKGVLVTTKAGDKVNSMTIGWGTYGTEWSTEMFAVYVRVSRYTRELLDANPEFTINIPMDNIEPDRLKEILMICGTKSGRDMDKVAELGLTLEDGDGVSVPAIKELPLTLECKVVFRQKQQVELIDKKFVERFYPVKEDGVDEHYAYYGEVVKAYIVE